MIHKLSINQITTAFPEECASIIPSANRRLKCDLKPYRDALKRIRNKHFPSEAERFLIKVAIMYHRPERIEGIIRFNESVLRSLQAPQDDKITDDMIERAKIVDILRLYDFEGVKQSHGRTQTCCPFHNDQHPSFMIYHNNNSYYCFSNCKAGGDSIQFVRKLHGFTFPAAVKYLLGR